MLLTHGPQGVALHAVITVVATAGIIFNLWYLARRGLVRLLDPRPTLAGGSSAFRQALSQVALLTTANCRHRDPRIERAMLGGTARS